eukprot:m.34329 g.34329  ORF g.34329 m.34329 type:complete len:53 (+) comp10690_c0_seq1:194-352(+)
MVVWLQQLTRSCCCCGHTSTFYESPEAHLSLTHTVIATVVTMRVRVCDCVMP